MKKRYVDPFSPDLPIDDPERFSGRQKEFDSSIDSLYQLANNNPTHTIITGDRGIGKSSMLVQIKTLAEGNNNLPDRLGIDIGEDSFDFISAWHDCAKDQTPAVLASGILQQLQNKFSNIFKKIQLELNIGGLLKISQKDKSASSISDIVDLFCTGIVRASEKAVENHKDGIVLFFDELDRVEPSSGVATFFKLSAERLSRDGIRNVAFFAAGITGAIQNMEEEHGSIYRTFKDIPLPRLDKPDVERILEIGFNAVNCQYDKRIFSSVYNLSAGYPEPVHILGSQILNVDDDDNLTNDDFERAKIQTVESLRRNKLSSMLKSAGSGKYQKIIEAMASHEGQHVPLSFISEKIGYEQNQYSTNMANLVKRDIISQVDRGVYCFVDPLLKEYISRFGVINSDSDE